MNDVQLRSFTVAVELGSFNKAAKGQFLSVPSFAQRINSLEAELGYRILERGPSGVRPTDAGLVLYRFAIPMIVVLAAVEGLTGVWWSQPPADLMAAALAVALAARECGKLRRAGAAQTKPAPESEPLLEAE